MLPATPDGRLVKMMRETLEKEKDKGDTFSLVEVGGNTIKSLIQKSNPTATPGCPKDDCMCCRVERGKGGPCHQNNVNYVVECGLCTDEKTVYIGETSRNLYTRMNEHKSTKDEGFISKHMREFHDGQEESFVPRVASTNKDCLSRQVREGVQIRRLGEKYRILNSKSEWHQPSLYSVRNELVRE